MRFDTGSRLYRIMCPKCGRYVAISAERKIRAHGPKDARCSASGTKAPKDAY